MNVDPIDEKDFLLKELAPPTEHKPDAFNLADFAPVTEFGDGIPDQPPGPKIKDFAPQPSEPVEPEPPAPAINIKEQAKLIIAFADGFQQLALPVAYQRSFFSKEDLEALKALKGRMEKQRDAPETVLTIEDQELYSKYRECQDTIDKLPFTEKEVNLMVDPTAEMMRKYNFKPGPEALFIGALFTVMGPRLAPLLVNINKL